MINNISNNKVYYEKQFQNKDNIPKTTTNKNNYLSYGLVVPSSVIGGAFIGDKIANNEKESFISSKNNIANTVFGTKEHKFRDKILSSFSDLNIYEKEGHPVDMPNCLMVTVDDPKYCERMINWIGKTGNAEYKVIEHDSNIVSILEQAETNYQASGNRTLLHVKNFEKIIDHSQVKDRIVEAAKDIMSAAAEDYYSTLIFSSTHPETLDNIALQPHRVEKIKTESIKTAEDSAIDDAKERLKNNDKAIETPISTINDLLTIARADKSLKVDWEYTPEQVNKAKHYIELYSKAKENLV